MSKLPVVAPTVQEKISTYPRNAKKQFLQIRRTILEIAKENSLGMVEETLKWGEPSYIAKGGSTIRVDWKAKAPDMLGVYLNCQTSLIETYKELYPDDFEYEGKRAIVIPLELDIGKSPLAHCLELALRYHRLKRLPLLGA